MYRFPKLFRRWRRLFANIALAVTAFSPIAAVAEPCIDKTDVDGEFPLYQYEASSQLGQYYLTLVPLGVEGKSARIVGAETYRKLTRLEAMEPGDTSGQIFVAKTDVDKVSIEALGLQFRLGVCDKANNTGSECGKLFDLTRGVLEFESENVSYKLVSCYGIFSVPFLREIDLDVNSQP